MCDPIVVRIRQDMDVPCAVDVDEFGGVTIDLHAGLRYTNRIAVLSWLLGPTCETCGRDTSDRVVHLLDAAELTGLAVS